MSCLLLLFLSNHYAKLFFSTYFTLSLFFFIFCVLFILFFYFFGCFHSSVYFPTSFLYLEVELGIADPQEEEWKDDIAQRILLRKGDSFFVPPGNIYR